MCVCSLLNYITDESVLLNEFYVCTVYIHFLKHAVSFGSVLGGGLVMYWTGSSSFNPEPTAELWSNPCSDRHYKDPALVKPISHSSPLYCLHGIV